MKNALHCFSFHVAEATGVMRTIGLFRCFAVSSALLFMSAPALHAQMPPDGGRPQGRAQADPLPDGPLIWDSNHDGVYTCDEWKSYMDRLFTLADKNRDGFVSVPEFAAIQRAEHTFADADLGYFDDNGDGKVSRSEFVNKPSLFIGRYDKNGDCRVTSDELKGGAPAQKQSPGAGKGSHGGQGGFGPKF